MRLLDLCNGYLLGLVVIQGLVMITIDKATFEYYKMDEVAKKSKRIGVFGIMIALILYVLKLIFGA